MAVVTSLDDLGSLADGPVNKVVAWVLRECRRQHLITLSSCVAAVLFNASGEAISADASLASLAPKHKAELARLVIRASPHAPASATTACSQTVPAASSEGKSSDLPAPPPASGQLEEGQEK